MELFEKALTFAASRHSGQTDKNGAAHLGHPICVALRLDDELDRAIALLHDTVEDAAPDEREAVVEYIRSEFPGEVLKSILTVTRDKERETYFDFIRRIRDSGDERAVRVKLADLADNTDPSRGPIPEGLAERYRKAMEMLRQDALI